MSSRRRVGFVVQRSRALQRRYSSVERGIIREVGTLYTVTRIVGTWMVQLLSAYGLCNCRMDRTDEIVSMARSIRDAFSDPSLPEVVCRSCMKACSFADYLRTTFHGLIRR